MSTEKYEITQYYDAQCVICEKSRSADFELSMTTDEALLRSSMKLEGWLIDPDTMKNICPMCSMRGIKSSSLKNKEAFRYGI